MQTHFLSSSTNNCLPAVDADGEKSFCVDLIAGDEAHENARNRREFLLGGKLDTWIPRVNEMCVATLERVVRAAQAQRAFLVILPMRPSLRETIEPEYEAAARLALREAASRLPRAALLDFSTRYDGDEANFNDFDHLTPTGAAAFTTELVELLR